MTNIPSSVPKYVIHVVHPTEALWCLTERPMRVITMEDYLVLRATQNYEALNDICMKCINNIQGGHDPAKAKLGLGVRTSYFLSNQAYSNLAITPRNASASIPRIAYRAGQYNLHLPAHILEDLAARAPWPPRVVDFTPYSRKLRILNIDDIDERELASIISRIGIPHRGDSPRAQAALALELILIGWLHRGEPNYVVPRYT